MAGWPRTIPRKAASGWRGSASSWTWTPCTAPPLRPKASPSGSRPRWAHSLRHSHGSHLLADGVPLPVVSERLGHSSVRTTAEVYAHALRGQDDEAARRWDEFQRRGTGDRPERKLQ